MHHTDIFPFQRILIYYSLYLISLLLSLWALKKSSYRNHPHIWAM